MSVTLESIMEEWKNDSRLDESRLNLELVRTPTLHAKYLEYFMFFRSKLAISEKKYNRMMGVKRRYFRGEMTKDELQKYGWAQWQGLKPTSGEFQILLESDEDMNNLLEFVQANKIAVNILEHILKQIGGRDWAVKSLIEIQKFQAGL